MSRDIRCSTYVFSQCPNDALPPHYEFCSEHSTRRDNGKRVRPPICSCAARIADAIEGITKSTKKKTLSAVKLSDAICSYIRSGAWQR